MILSFPKAFRLNHLERYEACFLFGYTSFMCVHPEALSGSSRPARMLGSTLELTNVGTAQLRRTLQLSESESKLN